MKTYKAILFHPAGDYVTDCKPDITFYDRKDQIEYIWDLVSDLGSKWIFYPIPFIATDKTIIDTPEGLEHLKGKRITTISQYFNKIWKENAEQVCEVINNGLPLNWIY